MLDSTNWKAAELKSSHGKHEPALAGPAEKMQNMPRDVIIGQSESFDSCQTLKFKIPSHRFRQKILTQFFELFASFLIFCLTEKDTKDWQRHSSSSERASEQATGTPGLHK